MPPIMSNARMHFDLIGSQENPFAYLSAIPSRTEPFFEEEWIDFKSAPANDEHGKRLWSRALSGFANTTDGLLIWGIDCRPTPPRGIDAPCGLRLIRGPLVFEQKLRDWIRDATNPPVMGVEIKSFAGTSGDGFAVCLIPESSHKPHRSEWDGKHYYIRASDDFLPAEPGLLRTLFYPKVSPRFEVTTKLEYRPEGSNHSLRYIFRCEAFVENTGTASAKNVTIAMNWNALPPGQLHPNTLWLKVETSRYSHAFSRTMDIHPGFHSSFMFLLN